MIFDTDDALGAAPFRFCSAENAALPAGPEHEHGVTRGHETGHLRSGAGHVEDREREALGHVRRELGVRAARKKHGFAFDIELCARPTHVPWMRSISQGEGEQRKDPTRSPGAKASENRMRVDAGALSPGACRQRYHRIGAAPFFHGREQH